MNITNIEKLILISIAYFLLFISFSTVQLLAAKVLELLDYENLGFQALATMYGFFAITSFFSSGIVNYLGKRMSLFVGSFCHVFWIVWYLCPAYAAKNPDVDKVVFSEQFIKSMLVIAAAVCGFGSSLLWVACFSFIAECAVQQNKGFFNAFFWAIYMFAQVFGCTLAALVIGHTDDFTLYYIVMSCIAFIGCLLFLLVRPIRKRHRGSRYRPALHMDTTTEQNNSEINNLSEIVQLNGFTEEVKATIAYFMDAKMQKVIPVLAWSGISLAIQTSMFIPLMEETMDPSWSPNTKVEKALTVMIALAIGELVGTLIYGFLLDKLGQKLSLIYVIVMTAMAFFLLLAIVEEFEFENLEYIMACAFGLQDSALNNFINCVLGFEFESKITPFSFYKVVQSSFVFAFIWFESMIQDQKGYRLYVIVVGVLAEISLFMMLKFDFKKISVRESFTASLKPSLVEDKHPLEQEIQ